MDSVLQELLAWMAQHPHYSNLLIFVIALLEFRLQPDVHFAVAPLH